MKGPGIIKKSAQFILVNASMAEMYRFWNHYKTICNTENNTNV